MKLSAQQRTETGTRASKKARREGLVPASIFGSSIDTFSVLVDRKDFEAMIREVGSNGVFTLDVEDDQTYQVFVKDQDNAAIQDLIYHIDLQAFLEGEKVVMDIPIYLEGEEDLEEAVANQSLSEVQIEIAPAEAPSEFYVDVTDLEVGDSISVEDLNIEGDVEIITELDATIVSISAPEEVIEVEETETDDMPEPEVIGASEDEDEEDAE